MAHLVAGADGTLVDPSDKESMIAAAEAVPGIEDQDINDGWLIEHTQQLDCGNGMMKYSITLPDGLPFECTPFRAENRRDMVKMWMAAVRGEIVQRAASATERTRAAALKERRDKQMQGAGIVVAGQIPTAQEAAALAAAVKQAPPPPPESARAVIAEARQYATQTAPAPSHDPLDYAQQQLEIAEEEYAYWADLAKKATIKQKAAQRAALKWKTVIEAFTETDPAPVVAASTDTVGGSRAERAVRRLQTSAIATGK